jgi:hypothetical protein
VPEKNKTNTRSHLVSGSICVDYVAARWCKGWIESCRDGNNDMVLWGVYRVPIVDDAVVRLQIIWEACGVYPYVKVNEAACHGRAHLLLLSFLRYGT